MELRGEIGVADIAIEVIQVSLGDPLPPGEIVYRETTERSGDLTRGPLNII